MVCPEGRDPSLYSLSESLAHARASRPFFYTSFAPLMIVDTNTSTGLLKFFAVNKGLCDSIGLICINCQFPPELFWGKKHSLSFLSYICGAKIISRHSSSAIRCRSTIQPYERENNAFLSSFKSMSTSS